MKQQQSEELVYLSILGEGRWGAKEAKELSHMTTPRGGESVLRVHMRAGKGFSSLPNQAGGCSAYTVQSTCGHEAQPSGTSGLYQEWTVPPQLRVQPLLDSLRSFGVMGAHPISLPSVINLTSRCYDFFLNNYIFLIN